MNSYLDIVSGNGFCAQQWFGLLARINKLLSRLAGCSLKALFLILLIGSMPIAAASSSQDALSQGEHQFQIRNFDAAFIKFKEVQANPEANASDLSLARCRLGIIYSIRDDQKQARSFLELAVSSNSLPESVSPLCFYALVQIYVIDKSYAEARDLIKKYPDPAFPALYKARVFALGSEVGRQLKDIPFEISQLEKLSRVMDIASISKVELKILGDWAVTKADVKQRLGEASKPKADPVPVQVSPTPSPEVAASPSPEAALIAKAEEKLSTQNSSSPNLESRDGQQDLFSAFKHFRTGHLQGAASDLRELTGPLLTKMNPELQVEAIKERAETLMKDDPRKMRVGLILPLGSGVFARLQLRAMKGLSAFLNSKAAKDVDYQVFVKTVSNDAGAAEEAASDLILKEKVHLIVGPFHGGQVIGAATVASFYGVPVFTLGPVTYAQEYDPAFVLRMGTLAVSQARPQVEYLKQKNRKIVAVMSPSDGYGVEMTRAFEAVCSRRACKSNASNLLMIQLKSSKIPPKHFLGHRTENIAALNMQS